MYGVVFYVYDYLNEKFHVDETMFFKDYESAFKCYKSCTPYSKVELIKSEVLRSSQVVKI